jgi:hypothetical protein
LKRENSTDFSYGEMPVIFGSAPRKAGISYLRRMAHHTLQELAAFIASGATLELNSDDKQRILACREYLDKKMALGGDPVYGINTGFGALCNTVVADDELGELQRNLLLSHACGMGEEVPQPDRQMDDFAQNKRTCERA